MKRVSIPLLTLLVGLLMGVLTATVCEKLERVTLLSLSPDDRFRVHFVDRSVSIDRNFDLRIERLDDGVRGSAATVFRSPDEGRPVGSERVVWSKDGKRFVLLGRHFNVFKEAELPNGESLYLMYDVESGKLWCNARQQSELPRFAMEDLPEMPWGSPDDSPRSDHSSQPRTVTPGL